MNVSDFKTLPVGQVIRTGIFEFKKVNLSYWKMSAPASFTPGDMETVLRFLQSEKSDLAILNLLDKSSKMPPYPDGAVSHE